MATPAGPPRHDGRDCCTPAEMCSRHREVLGRWWDHRDHAAVAVATAAVAVLALTPNRPSAAPVPAARRKRR